jgi:hypothetical protein
LSFSKVSSANVSLSVFSLSWIFFSSTSSRRATSFYSCFRFSCICNSAYSFIFSINSICCVRESYSSVDSITEVKASYSAYFGCSNTFSF